MVKSKSPLDCFHGGRRELHQNAAAMQWGKCPKMVGAGKHVPICMLPVVCWWYGNVDLSSGQGFDWLQIGIP